ncbi:MAG: dUTP diphosphatase [Pseudodesulfovibrio sp.]|uniref:dUTP diphosphatase n=1 Tax=Pseudodesulfovibrio aespoeensis (strain ATCC 700646 / DSM 10631 / Aspo-2) TaxID=643562 RepID=E6VWN3_PSEA9|nr:MULTISPECIES: dUTP diphosphatase [Pseudodesulfovibrio]MBU4243980.1 dUTP diphosphatase [Pseudomonadota bacterium]ADU62534.1 deoxyuridine 5'-triphosphate nucleotidohydrolase Dut [Pseudodesulfovibrio aespoeensis Aspo-2]MBU4377973.1 dUTP diphosphatase [Pseudomonadota bacterium]MBU4476278.1 dUTP diphosphatase [Pseudomonadota bacterium]MBU4516569.1 dUTP diphosphatase [Pseudomonadota bacterium]
MRKIDVNVKFMHPVWDENDLAYATEFSAGLDLRACIDVEELEIGPGEKKSIPAGVTIEIREPSVAGYVFSRSGLGTKDGLTVSQGVGVIDPDYRGEIKVSLLNTSGEVRRIRRGQRIAQLVFMPVFQAAINQVEELGATDRGAGGFGSTGKL